MPSPAASRSHRPDALWHRWVGLGCVELIALLNLLAVSPGAHAWLHAHPPPPSTAACAHDHAPDPAGTHDHDRSTGGAADDDDDRGCIVTQLAQGQLDSAAAPSIFVSGLRRVLAVLIAPVADARPHGLDLRLPPGCGPPAR